MQGKIFVAFSLIILLSIVSVTGIVYVNMSETIKRNAITSVEDSIRRADESLMVMLREIDRLNTVVVTNTNTVIHTLQSPNEEISYEWFQEKKRLEEFLSGLIDYKPYITRIAVVGLNGKVFFVGSPWLDRRVLQTEMMEYILKNGSRHAYFKPEGKTDAITVGREIRYDHETIGIVMVDLSYDFLRSTYSVKPTSDSLIYVLDEHGNFIYQPEMLESSESAVPPADLIVQLDQDYASLEGEWEQEIAGRSYIIVKRTSEYTGWSTLALAPMDSLLRESVRVRNLMIEVSVIVFVIVLFVSLQMSFRTTLHIRKLKSMMMQVKDGNLAFPRAEIRTKDEIGELYRVFISMVEELSRLMEDMRIREREKREAELTALQAQIRPHFLYNSLNTIKYLAQLNGVPNIVEISGSLIELMRSVLGNSNEYLTVREELQYVSNYIAIEKYKYMNRIQVNVEYEDEGLLDCLVLKLMLQPLVENAILHGIGPSTPEGVITIRLWAEQDDLVIEVEDDGKGMTQEEMAKVLRMTEAKESSSRFSGMGVRNVHERITLLYGKPYGVSLYSELGKYTKAVVRIPRMHQPESAVTSEVGLNDVSNSTGG